MQTPLSLDIKPLFTSTRLDSDFQDDPLLLKLNMEPDLAIHEADARGAAEVSSPPTDEESGPEDQGANKAIIRHRTLRWASTPYPGTTSLSKAPRSS
jgi:hypothetical protein